MLIWTSEDDVCLEPVLQTGFFRSVSEGKGLRIHNKKEGGICGSSHDATHSVSELQSTL